MLNEEQRARCVASLLESHRTKVQGPRPSEMYPEIEIADSYAISSAVAEAKVKAGVKIIGHKIGLTSKAMQAASKIDEPDYGYMFDDLVLADGAKVRFEDFCVPRVEPELTFVLKEPLKGPNVGLVDVLRATEWIIPSIEIIDARVTEPRRIFDTVADNGAAAGLVLGGRPVRPTDVDLRWVGAIFYRNSEIEETGLAAGVLGHPAMAVAWLANKLAPFDVTLEPGHMLLSGSFTRPVWAKKGDTLHADFGPLGSVAVQFV
ncbi:MULTISPECIES: fumarylacetoacetate hydrolase family protein [unclassified Shinella]|jgi:2-oxo-hept-3-ene-1,7-dioate hydratase|uniref:fumarylacetoacetate hydrolase family protein n=1 Tax=unclassified Shinella TaxID=2643062 RepID=UPI0003C549C3|nr:MULTISPECIES: fumarylacetoacetate hydrolase family protein [unclassified Shinella]EYR84649.1 2-oxo-hepta-3-ene-1,7-dioic acid hydratase HpcG [Shinella sp. DD12]MCO5149061.1 2-oxo-hepta-3-ene-1,7-dioate hydratase [Shinella sp.]MDC7265118.1 2-oxo-hepta-3-ene-1,7-dioate hydratase [Shinella sp. HY16]MDC7272015.1 2-oxo-hepta-3-ene-1,7-dioate hydratase [Shinella sp. YZ44]MDG4674241.1 2-oxo-hepta-3-ene-1,7-dioate hydratase [Shinella sp. 838]